MGLIIPDKIDPCEPLTRALFYPDDIQKSTYWVKAKALRPPYGSTDVSFNRACHLPSDAQKYLAKKIQRRAKPRCFLRMTQSDLERALKLSGTQNEGNDPKFQETAHFQYSPIYDLTRPTQSWPISVEKKWGNGYNPAHADLHYSIEYKKDEPNEFILLLTQIIINKDVSLCEFLCEAPDDFEKAEWCGDPLC